MEFAPRHVFLFVILVVQGTPAALTPHPPEHAPVARQT
jgi:hypothetical protein